MGTQFTGSLEASYRAYMTALIVGVADAFLCLIYDITYGSVHHNFAATLLNVSCILLGMLAIFSLIGMFYMVIRRFFRKGDLIFLIIFAMLTIWFVWAIHWAHFSADAIENASLRGEYTGFTVISGLCAVIGIPLLRRSHRFAHYIV